MTHRTSSLATRLLLAQLLIIGVMTATTLALAALIGPGVFHDHLHQSAHPVSQEVAFHAEQAFFQAGGLALGAGITCGVLVGALVSLVVTRRLGRTMAGLSRAAEKVAAGVYDAPLPAPGAGREVDSLVQSFATMADRLEGTENARRRLLTDVAHELRTPISSIRVTLEAIEDGVVAPDAATLAMLTDQTARLERLAGDMRAVSAAEEGRLDLDPAPVTPAAIAAAARPFRERAAAKGVRLTVDAMPGVTFTADAARLQQVLTNLLANALRHTPAGGEVALTCDADEGQVVFTVRDSGDGITPEHLPHVFERFYRADTARDRGHGGSGVGLTISAGIARAHGGTLTASSEGLGLGSAFTLTLPRR